MTMPFQLRPAILCLLTSLLSAGLTSCSPSISDIEFKAAEAKAAEKEARHARLESEAKALMLESKQLNTFKGPDHERAVKRAESLFQEKTDLEGIKAEVEKKVAHFTSEAQRHRDALAKETP